ncbi:sugar-transfer associated ATP-grasp domain-containing protein [Sediminicola sp. 1XM1-17]|uniref:sugar-transfer associated ATP-grasp domain-containing protein n=1 Tax=Sediminicola sp. 1XM1-17 TaxID=3127702 RepID=UPI003076F770
MKEQLLQFAKSFGTQLIDQRFHFIHKQQAKNVLKSIESCKGVTEPKFIKLSDEYANDILGWGGYAPWLYVYSAIAEEFKEGWIPDNYYGAVVVPSIQGDYGNVSHLKGFTNKIFQSPVFPDIAYYNNGLFFTRDYESIPRNQVKNYVFQHTDVLVFKSDQSAQGKGVIFLTENSFDDKSFSHLGNGVFQPFIKQHSFFNAFTPDSVATIRLTTVIEENGISSLRAGYLRLGRSKDSHVQSSSHIRIPISIVKGQLEDVGYMPNWVGIPQHPDSGAPFANKIIPGFGNCISTALKLHQAMPMVRSIGWDMIVDEQNNVKVMEWNGHQNDIKFSEATQGPCFADLGWEQLWQGRKNNMVTNQKVKSFLK